MRTTAAMLLLALPAGLGAETVRVAGNDSGAIAAAVEQSEAGDTVLLPAGEYEITEPIRPESGTHLLGEGRDDTVLRPSGSAVHQLVLLSQVEDVEVARMTLDGNGSPALAQGLYATDSHRLSIHHVAIRNLVKSEHFGPMGIHFNGVNPTREGGVTDSTIADCILQNIGVGASFGSGIRVSWGSSRNCIERCTIDATGRGGIFGDNGSTDLIIRGNRVTGSGGEGLGIEVWGGCDRSVIEDNTVDHWLSVGGCDYCSVRRNLVASRDGTTKPYGLEIIGSYEVITGNVVDDTQGIGISVSSKMPKNYHYYADNDIRGCYHWGVQLQGEDGGCAYYYFLRCKFRETLVEHPAVRYKGGEGNGFRTNGNVKHVVLEDCEFTDNGKFGLQLGGAGVDALSFVRCIITGNGLGACVGPGEYTALEWVDCEVEENGKDDLPPEKAFDADPPTASFECAEEAKVGETVTFRSTTEDAEAMLWDLGDGPPLTEEEVTHTYSKPGDYTVTLIVWNEAGRGARAEKTVRVTE